MRALPAAIALIAVACGHTEKYAHDQDVHRAQLALAHELAARRAWPEVILATERIHAGGPRTAETLTLRGVAYREQRLFDEADADLRRAIALDGGYAPAQAALAVLLDVRGEPAAAEPFHKRALELSPEDPGYLNDWGFSLFMRGKAPEAVEVLRRAAERAPLDRRIRNNLGFALAKTGDYARAAQQFALGGTPAEAKNNLGFAYESGGNMMQAFDAYIAAARLDPGLRRARTNLEHVAHQLNRAVPPDLADAGPPPPRRTP